MKKIVLYDVELVEPNVPGDTWMALSFIVGIKQVYGELWERVKRGETLKIEEEKEGAEMLKTFRVFIKTLEFPSESGKEREYPRHAKQRVNVTLELEDEK